MAGCIHCCIAMNWASGPDGGPGAWWMWWIARLPRRPARRRTLTGRLNQAERRRDVDRPFAEARPRGPRKKERVLGVPGWACETARQVCSLQQLEYLYDQHHTLWFNQMRRLWARAQMQWMHLDCTWCTRIIKPCRVHHMHSVHCMKTMRKWCTVWRVCSICSASYSLHVFNTLFLDIFTFLFVSW
jgi:hypothetical protein